LIVTVIVYHIVHISVFIWVPHYLYCVGMLSNSRYYTTFRLVHHLTG